MNVIPLRFAVPAIVGIVAVASTTTDPSINELFDRLTVGTKVVVY